MSIKSRTCEVCGKSYVKVIGVSFTKYCSQACRDLANKELASIRHKEMYVPSPREHATCAVCGKEFVCKSHNHIHCSEKCARIDYERTHPDHSKKYEYQCQYCGKTFLGESRRKGYAGMYCSVSCRNKGIAIQKALKNPHKTMCREPMLVTCNYCETKFSTINSKKIYCSKECILNASRERAKLRNRKLAPIVFVSKQVVCKYCGRVFTTQYKKSKQFCSDECKINQARALHKHYKRRLVGKVIDKDITIQKLAKKHRNKCALCGGKVDWNDYKIVDGAFIVGDWYPSIDHVIPVSLGGMHSWDNVQLAHMKCNTQKGNNLLVCQVAAGAGTGLMFTPEGLS